MQSSDIYGFFVTDSKITIQDYWCPGYYSIIPDEDQGGSNSITLISSLLESDSFQVVFKRRLNTGDSFDKAITPNQKSSIIWAYVKTSGTSYHGSDRCNFYLVMGELTWSTSGSSNFEIIESSDDDDSKRHGVIMTFAWGPLAGIGIFVARHFKSRSWWFYVHFLCLFACSIITIASSTGQYDHKERSYEYFDDDALGHSRIGLALTSLVIAQVLFGMLTSYTKIFTKSTQLTILLMRAHKLIGYCMFIAGLRNVYSGWDIYGEIKSSMIIIYTIIAVAFVTAELIQIFYRNKLKNPSKKLAIMSHFDVIEEVKKGRKLMFADDLVIDVGHFYRAHPGGSFMLVESLGEDTGKYMVGCSSYGGTLNPYAHSDKAFSMLPELAIGRIESPPGYLKMPSDFDDVFMDFLVHSTEPLNQHTYMIHLTCSDVTVNNKCKDPSWLGKHFMVTYKEKLSIVKRYYSALFSDYRKWTGNELVDASFETQQDETKNMLKLIFKVYQGGKMTQHLNKLNPGSLIKIKGPLGPGLLLKTLKGKFLALAGGTGLVPFLDLVSIAWKQFGSSSNEFSFTLYVFFRTREDGFALEELKSVADGCNWLDLNIITDEHKDKKGIPNQIKSKIENGVDLAWVCGPSGFNRYYSDTLKSFGLDRFKIIVM